jgi:DNA repair photolyase
VTLRLDPVFPGLNDAEIEEIVGAAVQSGARHVTSSTFKPRPDSWTRFSLAFPEEARRMADDYFRLGGKHHNARYLPRRIRLDLMARVEKACGRAGVTFATCREGFRFRAPTCDGSHLIRTAGQPPAARPPS